jgi:hypothetical protein
VGPSLEGIEAVLAGGNIREVWALLYALTKTNYITTILTTLLSNRSQGAPIAAKGVYGCTSSSSKGFRAARHHLQRGLGLHVIIFKGVYGCTSSCLPQARTPSPRPIPSPHPSA